MSPDFAATDATLAGDGNCNPGDGGPAEDLANGATHHPNLTNILDEAGDNLNFSSVITFTPNTLTIAAGGAHPVGTKMGGLHSATTLSLFSGPCNFPISVDFVLFNVALPTGMTTPGDARTATNIGFPRPEGDSDRFGGWNTGALPPHDGGTAPTALDGGHPDNAGSGSLFVTNYPSYLLDLFDPDYVPGVGDNADGGANSVPKIPTALYGGMTRVGGSWIPLYFAQFDDAGGVAANNLVGLPAPLGLMTAANLGQPSVSVLQDPTAVQASVSDILDFCTPLNVTTMLLGSPGGTPRLTSPTAVGTQFFEQFNSSLRDTDQDGYENALDTCPGKVNTDNPKTTDADGDMIDSSCDPTPGSGSGLDTDGDSYKNNLDNCPLVANGTNTITHAVIGPSNQEEAEIKNTSGTPDKGPKTDSIGDPCDSELGTINIKQNCTPAACPGATTNVSITMADNVSNGRYMAVMNTVAKCFGGTDLDLDGYCSSDLDSGTDGAGGDACLLDSPVSCAVQHTAWSAATNPALANEDTDGDRLSNPLPYSDAAETYLGTDATKPCAMTSTTGDEGISAVSGGTGGDNFPLDFNDDQLVNGQDILKYNPVFGKPVNTALTAPANVYPSGRRWDLNFDGLINGQDILKFNTGFGKNCGDAGAPPLLNGTVFQQ